MVVDPSKLVDFRSYSLNVPGFVTPYDLLGNQFVVTKAEFGDILL